MAALDDDDYGRLFEFRSRLRQFLSWSEQQAVAAGITPQHHQLLLAVRGHRGDRPPTIGELAEALGLRHHSVGELINRAETAGLVARQPDADDRRVTHLTLTRQGKAVLQRLSEVHLDELRRLQLLLDHDDPTDAG